MARFGFEVKFATSEAADDGVFSGYGSVFGKPDSYDDVIQKGAFKASIAGFTGGKTAWPAMLEQHGFLGGAGGMTPIGIWTSIEEDDAGLKVEGKLALETQRGAELYALMKMQPRPAISGLSIGFRAREFTMGTKAGEPRRVLKAVDLFEISLVTFPAQTLAQVDDVKSDLTKRELECLLVRDAGLSAQQAKALIAGGFKALPGARDSAGEDDDGAFFEALKLASERMRG